MGRLPWPYPAWLPWPYPAWRFAKSNLAKSRLAKPTMGQHLKSLTKALSGLSWRLPQLQLLEPSGNSPNERHWHTHFTLQRQAGAIQNSLRRDAGGALHLHPSASSCCFQLAERDLAATTDKRDGTEGLFTFLCLCAPSCCRCISFCAYTNNVGLCTHGKITYK